MGPEINSLIGRFPFPAGSLTAKFHCISQHPYSVLSLSNINHPQTSLPSSLDAEIVRRGRSASLEVLEAEIRRLRSSVEEASGREAALAVKRQKLAEVKDAMKMTENVVAALTSEWKRCRDDVVDQVDEGDSREKGIRSADPPNLFAPSVLFELD